MHVQGDSTLPRLTSRLEFQQYAASAKDKWNSLWSSTSTVVTVLVGSSSIAKGAETVLDAAAEYALMKSNVVVRKTGVDGADWMEVQVTVKRPGGPLVHYANVTPDEIVDVIEGRLESKALGVDGDQPSGNLPPLKDHPFFKYQ
ncbi:MAG TPA: hypothetical protein VEQ36_00265, partial [Thermomicrobiales bacterium]|nr:hypothetical protein [Thermomicrobiales bacterium]